MNKVEYISCLADNLKRLPHEDFKKAMEYFQEYFEEAGLEKEQQAIEDLGTPALAADQIIRNIAIRNAEEPHKSMKKGLSAVWIGILAVFAAPVALPLAFAFAMVAFALVITAFALIFSLILVGISLIAASLIGFVGGVFLLFSSPLHGLATIGVSLVCAGISLLVSYGCYQLSKYILRGMITLFGKFAKGGKKHEKQD